VGKIFSYISAFAPCFNNEMSSKLHVFVVAVIVFLDIIEILLKSKAN